MKLNRMARFCALTAVLLAGVWLVTTATRPAPETLERQEAVLALGPGGATAASLDPEAAELDVPEVIFETASPVGTVNLAAVEPVAELPPSELDRYLSGEITLGAPESTIDEQTYQRAKEWSAAQGPDSYLAGSAELANTAPLQLPIGARFDAISYTDSQAGVPPDDVLVVGKDHVVVAVNTSLAIYDKDGNELMSPMRFETVWGEACGQGSTDQLMFDPYMTYDESADRYIIGITATYLANNGNPTNTGYLCMLVSQTDDATGDYYQYSFNCNPGSNFLNPAYFCDYPQIGIGRSALYGSANMFNFGILPLYARAHVFAFDKEAMYAGQPANFTKVNIGGLFNPLISFEPADMHGFDDGGWAPAGEPHYFINSDIPALGNGTSIRVYALNNPLGNPSLTQVAALSVDSYRLPVDSPQLNGPNIQANDTRIQDAEYWGGKIYASHTIACNPGSGTVNCARFYEIDVSGSSPTLVQQGTHTQNGVYRSFPNVAVDSCGNLGMTYTEATNSTFPSMAGTGQLPIDPPGSTRGSLIIKAGESPYNAYDPTPHRFGDYHGTTIDPDGKTFWAVGEFSRDQQDADWVSHVVSYQFPNCQ